jgi:hypothetical protein
MHNLLQRKHVFSSCAALIPDPSRRSDYRPPFFGCRFATHILCAFAPLREEISTSDVDGNSDTRGDAAPKGRS